jgi:hypothetical protein
MHETAGVIHVQLPQAMVRGRHNAVDSVVVTVRKRTEGGRCLGAAKTLALKP